MKRGRSTTTPTREESERIEKCKARGCIACRLWVEHPDCPPEFRIRFTHYSDDGLDLAADYHHLLSGGIRRGHMYGVALCAWHHRGVLDWGSTGKHMQAFYGPSLARGSKAFHDTFGDDQALLDKQAEILGET